MKETNENQKTKKGKHKAKPTIGDIVFHVLIIVAIFFIVVIAYVFYLRGTMEIKNLNKVNAVETVINQ